MCVRVCVWVMRCLCVRVVCVVCVCVLCVCVPVCVCVCVGDRFMRHQMGWTEAYMHVCVCVCVCVCVWQVHEASNGLDRGYSEGRALVSRFFTGIGP